MFWYEYLGRNSLQGLVGDCHQFDSQRQASRESSRQVWTICDAAEVVLFERATFLVISQVEFEPAADAHRFEKISNIVKQFKLSISKAQAQFQGLEVRNSKFSCFIDAFTANTYIMVIVNNKNVHTAATLMNIQNAREHFETFIPRI